MQKKIIALAVAAAFSTPAFADVGFYGIIDASVAAVSVKGQKSDLIVSSGAASTSRLGLKATEDIGNGLTAVGVIEYGIDTVNSDGSVTGANPNQASAFSSRQKMLAVAGDFGTVAAGHLQTTGYDWQVKFDPIAGSTSSPLQLVNGKTGTFLIGTVAGLARAQRAVAYTSPNISGLTFAANYSTSLAGAGDLGVAEATTTPLKNTAYLFSGTYTLDALTVGAVYAAKVDTSGGAATANDQSEFAIGGSYDLGVAKVMGTFQSNKSDLAGSKTNTAYSLSGVLPVSTGAFAVLFGGNKIAEDTSLSATALTAGYMHTFTKLTTGYVVFTNVKNGSGTFAYSVSSNAFGVATQTPGGSSSSFGVGLRKKF